MNILVAAISATAYGIIMFKIVSHMLGREIDKIVREELGPDAKFDLNL